MRKDNFDLKEREKLFRFVRKRKDNFDLREREKIILIWKKEKKII